jgi:hypothetical protein
MSYYNLGTGLVDVDATTVRTSALTTETIGSESGLLDCQFSQLTNVALVNGVSVQQTSNVAHFSSNLAVWDSNAITAASNAVWPVLSYSSNLGIQNSNAISAASNSVWPVLSYSSNLGIQNSNAISAASNAVWPVLSYSSNTSTNTSNLFASTFSSTAAALSNLRPNLVSPTVTASNLDVTQGIVRINGATLLGTDRKIDYNTWIKNGPVFSQDNTLAAAGITLGAAGLVSSLGGQLLNNQGQLGASVLSDIGKKLGEEVVDEAWDPSESESNLQVHYNAVLYPPLHKNLNSHEVGFASNVHVNSNAKLYSIRSSDLTKADGGRFKRIATNPSRNLVIDFAERDFFGRNFSAVNVTASNNITCDNLLTTVVTAPTVASSNITGTNVITMNMTCSNVSTKSLWLGAGGLYTQDPVANPLTAVQVINAQGFYMGTVSKDQVLGNESLDWGKLNDGIMSLQSSTNTYTNPFGIVQENAFFSL